MNRTLIVAIALLAPSCGGGGTAPPIVKSNTEEVKSRRDEIKAIADVPGDASGEVPTLLKAMSDTDPEVRWLAEYGLGRVNARGIKALVDALQGGDPALRWTAAFVLGPMGKRAASAVPALLKLIEDKEKNVRLWSLKALGDIDLRNPEVVAAIVRLLRDPDPDIRRVALNFVIQLGPAATGAGPVLVDVLQDADAGIRLRACRAFRRLEADGKAGIPALIVRLSDYDADVRAQATEALSKIGPVAVDPLVRALKERDPRVRRGAAEAIGWYGAEAKMAVIELNETAKDDDEAVKAAATLALKRIEGGEAPKGSAFIDPPGAIQRRSEDYRWARFGLLIHAGLPSVPARAKPGQAAEMIQQNERLPLIEYELFALKFGLSKFKPEEWAKLANESGARYLVMTAKHHDGYCLWNTKLTQYKARRDVLADLAAACEKEKVKFGAYYSLLDWYQPAYEKNVAKYVEFVHGQVKELLAGYPLWGIWFDGEGGRTKEEWRAEELITMIRQAKPLSFINDRLGRDTRGTISGVDFYTQEPDATVAALKLQGRPLALEYSHPFGESWGYNESLDPLKSGERIITEIVHAASKGGNFLLQIGARPDGSIPDAFQARLRVVGDWLRKNGEAIYDTERSPWLGTIPAGRVTVKNNRLYVFLEEVPKDGVIALPGLKTPVREAWVVHPKRELKVRDAGVQAPDLVPGSPVTVVAIELERAPEIGQ